MFKTIKKNKIISIIVYSIDILVIGLFIAFMYPILKDSIYAITIFGIVVLMIPLCLNITQVASFDKALRKYYLTIGNTIGADIAEAYKFGEIGLAAFNEDKIFIWTSGLFSERKINILGESIIGKFPQLGGLMSEDNPENKLTTHVYINKRNYEVVLVSELDLFIFKDVTNYDSLAKKSTDEQPILCSILIDDFDSIEDIINDADYSNVVKEIDDVVNGFAKDHNFFIYKPKDDVYQLIGLEKDYNEIKEQNFDILEKISKIHNKETTITASIGIGRGICDYNKLLELSKEALNVAESRGGNQVVTNTYEKNMFFFGGQGVEKVQKTNTVKLRIMGRSFISHVQSASELFLIPHVEADFDAIGSCIGLYQFAKRLGKKAYIICDEKQIELKTRLMLNDLFDDEILLSQQKALNQLNEQTLVIVCDVSNPKIVTAPKIVEQAKKIAVIDHHRESEYNIDNPLFVLRDINASSTCEIVSLLMFEIGGNTVVPKEVSTFVLAGIILDTHNLTVKTTSATFKACMFLEENHADVALANSYMKDEYEEYELKAKVLSNIESPMYGIVVSSAPEDEILERASLAKIAMEAINIKGIKAAFILGYIDKKVVGISARSDGNINTQLIMEKLGGGGHHSSSACQIENTTIEDAKKELIGVIKLYNNEF